MSTLNPDAMAMVTVYCIILFRRSIRSKESNDLSSFSIAAEKKKTSILHTDDVSQEDLSFLSFTSVVSLEDLYVLSLCDVVARLTLVALTWRIVYIISPAAVINRV